MNISKIKNCQSDRSHPTHRRSRPIHVIQVHEVAQNALSSQRFGPSNPHSVIPLAPNKPLSLLPAERPDEFDQGKPLPLAPINSDHLEQTLHKRSRPIHVIQVREVAQNVLSGQRFGPSNPHSVIPFAPNKPLLSLSKESERRIDKFLSELREDPVEKSSDSQESCLVEMTYKEYMDNLKSLRNKKATKTIAKSTVGLPFVALGSLVYGCYMGYKVLSRKPYDISKNKTEIKKLEDNILGFNDSLNNADVALISCVDEKIKILKKADPEFQKLQQDGEEIKSNLKLKESKLSSLKEELEKLTKQQKPIAALKDQIKSLQTEIKDLRNKQHTTLIQFKKKALDIEKKAIKEIKNDLTTKKRIDRLLNKKENIKSKLEEAKARIRTLREEGQKILKKRRFVTILEKNLTWAGIGRNFRQARHANSMAKQDKSNRTMSVDLKMNAHKNQLPVHMQNKVLSAAYRKLQKAQSC